MDKKQKRKLIPAVCFVLICGTGYLGLYYAGKQERIVLERASEEAGVVSNREDEAVETDGPEAIDTEGKEVASGQRPVQMPLYVHVCGAVTAEGVYALPEGSRVEDAVAAAGGFADEADRTYHNLAEMLTDGRKVYVPTTEETKDLPVAERVLSGDYKDFSAPGGIGEKKVNLNTADVSELMTLNGIGEAKATSILQYRRKVGLFQSIEELKNVSGIGDAMFEQVREYITVD